MTILLRISRSPTLILGFAKEGRSTYKFLRKHFPKLSLGVADRQILQDLPRDSHTSFYLGDNYLKSISRYKVIVKTPGIPLNLPKIQAVAREGKLISSQTQIFLENCPGSIIGITGTKGKSTTTSVIYHVLHENHIPSVILGNIGIPPLDHIEEGDKKTYYIFEMSSAQLVDVDKSPHIAVLQNIVPDHLDTHRSFTEYLQAKANITKFQTPVDYLVYNADYPIPRKIASRTKARTIPFSLKQPLLDLKDTNLIGEHNLYNVMPAIIIGRLLGLEDPQIFSAIKTFKPLEHRLQDIGTFRGITFFEDAIASVPQATIAALDALGPRVRTLILGGTERKQNYRELARRIIRSQIETVLLFPTTGKRVWSEIRKYKNRKIKHFFVNNMETCIKLAFQETTPGSICLLSTAAPSHTISGRNMIFKNHEDKAQQYRAQVISQFRVALNS